MIGERYVSGPIDLRCGDWREVLADVGDVSAVITDPPYSERVEDGFRSGSTMRDLENKPGMGYAPIDEAYCRAFVASWAPRNRGWFFVFGDHITFRWWESALVEAGLYVFPPVVWAKTGAAPRMSCDGPASHCEYAAVARPRRKEFLTWGSLRGWYEAGTVRHGHGHNGVSGAKPLELMRAILADYTRQGDLVADPHCGSGTTALACAIDGRRCVTSEINPSTYAKAVKRLSAGWTPSLLTRQAAPAEQLSLVAK